MFWAASGITIGAMILTSPTLASRRKKTLTSGWLWPPQSYLRWIRALRVLQGQHVLCGQSFFLAQSVHLYCIKIVRYSDPHCSSMSGRSMLGRPMSRRSMSPGGQCLFSRGGQCLGGQCHSLTIITNFVKNCLATFNCPNNKIKGNVCYSDPMVTMQS